MAQDVPPRTPINAIGRPGQSDLDEAVLKRIPIAESNNDLEAVAALIESGTRQRDSAKKTKHSPARFGWAKHPIPTRPKGSLGAMIRLARPGQHSKPAFRGRPCPRRRVKYDPGNSPKAHMLIAQLNLLEGRTEAIRKNPATAAMALYDDNPTEQSKGVFVAWVSQNRRRQKIADLNAAIECESQKHMHFRERAGHACKRATLMGPSKTSSPGARNRPHEPADRGQHR